MGSSMLDPYEFDEYLRARWPVGDSPEEREIPHSADSVWNDRSVVFGKTLKPALRRRERWVQGKPALPSLR